MRGTIILVSAVEATLFGLKLGGELDWSWLMVFMPFILPVVYLLFAYAFGALYGLITGAADAD